MVQSNGIGSSVPGFNLGQLRSVTFPLPPLVEQRAIADVLGALDDKIESNRRTSRALERVARATDMAPYVSLKDQRQMSVPVFPSSQHTVAPKIEGLLARQSAAIQESKTLAKVRDYLLPKLLSGEVRVEEGSVCSILETTAASRKRRRGHV